MNARQIDKNETIGDTRGSHAGIVDCPKSDSRSTRNIRNGILIRLVGTTFPDILSFRHFLENAFFVKFGINPQPRSLHSPPSHPSLSTLTLFSHLYAYYLLYSNNTPFSFLSSLTTFECLSHRPRHYHPFHICSTAIHHLHRLCHHVCRQHQLSIYHLRRLFHLIHHHHHHRLLAVSIHLKVVIMICYILCR